MGAADRLCPRSNWWLAFLLSALVHAVVIFALMQIPGPKIETAQAETGPTTIIFQSEDDEGGGSSPSVLFPTFSKSQIEPSVPVPPAPPQTDIPPNKIQIDPSLFAPSVPASNPDANFANSHQITGGIGGASPGSGIGKGSSHGTGAGKGFFQIPVLGRKIVYVLDRSSSMGKQGALELAKRELLASLHSLPADAFFQIIVYNSTANVLVKDHPDWFPATLENLQVAAQELAQLEATRGTVHHLALPMALTLQPDVVFFLTDADDLNPGYLAQVTQQNQGRAIIHAIELNTANVGFPDAPLQVFARQNRGVYRAVALSEIP